MTSREIIRRIIEHDAPPRLGWDYYYDDGAHADILHVSAATLKRGDGGRYAGFARHEDLTARSGFDGETMLDVFGNIYGRFEGKTKGECVLGALETGWEALDGYSLPPLDRAHSDKIMAMNLAGSDKYVLSGMPCAVFSTLRDLRKMDNALMDTLTEVENVERLLDMVCALATDAVNTCADCGVDGVIMYDDWGTQISPFISPASFDQLFAPAYKRIADACHQRGLHMFLHSCGYVRPLIDSMISAGIDAFQFDQPEASGSRFWAENYGRSAAFYCPVDIQKIMPTGDRTLIERAAIDMATAFRLNGGSLIGKDYGGPMAWLDIDVKLEWAKWAMDAFIENSFMG